MADYILDIDTKFLQNLKAADAALAKSIANTKMISTQFSNMVQRSQAFGKSLGNVQAAMSKLGSGATVDFSKGIVSINTAAMTATDKVNLLTQSVQQLRAKYDELQSSTTRKGMALKSSDSLTDIAKVEAALRQAENKLAKGTSPAKSEHLRKQVELYKAAMRELTKSDDQRTKEAVREVQRRTAEANKEADAKIKQSDRETNAIRKNHEKLQRSLEKKTKSQPMDSQSAMELARQARSVEELKRAYKALERSRNRINPDTREGQKQIRTLNKTMDETEKKISRITRKNKNMRDSFASMSDIVGGLGGKLALVFGATAIKNYVNNLIKIHGQFELINKSLEILLHSSARAERVWGQITDLALKSPFQIKELATATKQMAAYRIEADQLYEKTRMLADISAGLGVQMSRLILAYGQVKAANFLRGTELRQFSEAGIDMLGQLSAYFTEMEGRAVSAADVFERISKRLVLFEDVDAVLTRVTSQGGAFYQMQEEQSKTLTGQIRNLKDEIDLMFHDIGKSTHGIIMSVVKVIRDLIRNWREVLPILLGAITAFTTMKVVMMGYGVYLTFVNRSLVNYTTTTVGATLATQAFNTALKSNPIFLLASLIATAIAGIMSYIIAANSMSESNEEAAETLNSVAKIFDEQAMQYDRLTSKIMDFSDEIGELKKEQEGLEETDERYLQINEELSMAMSARNAAISSLININSEYANSLDGIAVAANSVADAETRMKVVEKELRNLYAGKKAANAIDVDNLAKNLKAIQDGYAAILDQRTKIAGIDTKVTYGSFGSTVTFDVDKYKLVRESGEGLIAYMERIWNLRLSEWEKLKGDFENLNADSYKDAWKSAGTGLWEISEGGKAYSQIEDMINKSASDYLGFLGKTFNDVVSNTDLQGMVYEHYEKILAESDLDSASQDILRQMLGSVFGFKWPEVDPKLMDWQKNYNKYRQAFIDEVGKRGDAFRDLANGVSRVIRSSHITVDQMKEELDAEIKALEQKIRDYETGALYMTPFEYDNLKFKLEVAKYYRAFYGAPKSTGGKKESPYRDTLKAIDEIHKAFKSLEKDFDVSTAKIGAWEKYGASLDTALKKIKMTRDQFVKQFGDLTSEKSVTDAIEWLAKQAKDADEKFDIQQHLGQWRWELNLEVEKKEFDDAVKAIDEMFAGYELSIELDKLHVPKDFAKDFFNVDTISLEELRKKVYAEQGKFDGTDDVKKFEEYLKKIDQLETKAQQERLKKYLKYSKNAIGERGKILLEEIEQIQEIEQTFALTNTLALNKELISSEQKSELEKLGKSISEIAKSDKAMKDFGFTDEQIKKIKEFNAELDKQRDTAKKGVQRDTAQKLDKFDFEQFKGSEVFQELYSDLENASSSALNVLISKLDKHSKQWENLPIDQVKEYTKLLKDAQEALNSNKMPRELIADQLAVINKSGYKNIGEASEIMAAAEEQIEQLEREKSIVEEIANMRAQGIKDEEIKKTLQAAQIPMVDKTLDSINDEVETQKTLILDAQAFLDAIRLISKAYEEQIKTVQKVKTVVDKVFDGWGSINSLFEDGSMSAELLGMFQTLSDAVFEMREMVSETKSAITNLKAAEEGATKFGFALDTASGIIGIIVAGIKAAVGLFEYQNDKINDDIEANMRTVEKLQHAYEDLERQIEDAFTSDSISSLTKELNRKLEAQKREIEDNISLEEDKKDKNKDQGKIDEWNRQLDDIERQQAENIEKIFSTLTDGVLDNVLNATRGFVDAWYDAYDETGDGMKGLENNFKEMFANILKQQASLTLISPFIDDFKSQLEGYMNDSRLTANEATALRAKWEEIAPQMNEALEQYFDSFSGILDNDYGELSDLEKGIQGMTEDQAEVLAAYWNSCRFILANIDNTLANLATNVLGDGNSENPIVSAIKHQTTVIEQIRDMVGSVIANGGGLSTHSLSYIRVNDA